MRAIILNECRPENAKRRLLDDEGGSDGVTLEEAVKKETDVKPGVKELKRRRSTATKNKLAVEGNAESEDSPKPRKREREKKEEEDEEYVPETEKKKSPKKEAVAVKVESKTDILQQAVKEATLEEVSEEVVMEDVDTKQILSNHKIPEGLKIFNIEKPIVKVETPKTKLPEPKPSSVSQSLSKATITPAPAQSTKPANPTTTAEVFAQVTKTNEISKSVSTPSSNISGASPKVVPRQGSQAPIR